MSQTKVQLVSNIVGNVSGGASFTGIVTASSFSGSISGTTGTASTASFATTSFGLSGNPNITVGNITASNVTGSAATFTNLTVNGTQTIINTTSLEITDKNIGIGSTSTPSDALADGAGITIYGTTNKTLTWSNTSKNWGLVGGGLTIASGNVGFSTITANFPFQVGSGSTIVFVDTAGDLGIGTTNATSKLHVVGDALISGVVTATSYRGDGSQLTGVSAGLTLRQAGTTVAGGAATTVNFASGATITPVSAGIATITIAAGIQTEALTSSGITTTLDLSKQDHKVTATGITTITVSGGTEGDSHTVRIVNSGIATIGFSTFFLFPSGSPPTLPTTSGAISLLSFTVHRVGTAGTQLLAGASLNFS